MVIVPAPVLIVPVATGVCPPDNDNNNISMLAEVGLAGVVQALQPGLGLLQMAKRFTGMLKVTGAFGGSTTTPGLAFAITSDLRQPVVFTVHPDPLLPAHAALGSGSGAA